jgi:hypothetical protein
VDTAAWIVVSHALFAHKVINPKNITGEWYIKVVQADGNCIVTITLTSIDTHSYPPLNGVSTGVFEKIIANKIM